MIYRRKKTQKEDNVSFFASDYDDFVIKYHTLPLQKKIGEKEKNNLLGWKEDPRGKEAILFIDVDQQKDNTPFIDWVTKMYKCCAFLSQSSTDDLKKFCIVLPLYFETNDDLNLFMTYKPGSIYNLFKSFGIHTDGFVDKDVLKTRQFRFAYRSAYDCTLFTYPDRQPLFISHQQLIDALPKQQTNVPPESINFNLSNVNSGTPTIKTNVSVINENIYNFENLFDPEKYPLDQSNNTLAWLFSAASGVIDNEVLFYTLKQLLIERGSTKVDEHLKHFSKYLINNLPRNNTFNLKINKYVSEILPQLDYRTPFLLRSPTGSGKSRVATYLRDQLGYKPLVIVPRKGIRAQWEYDYKIDAVCYQKFIKGDFDTSKYNCMILDEQHLLNEFADKGDYKKFIDNIWNQFNGLKVCLSATPDYKLMDLLFPNEPYNVYDIDMTEKENVVQIILEKERKKIISMIARNIKTPIWGERNYIIFCDNKIEGVKIAGDLQKTVATFGYKVFNYYTRENEKEEEEQGVDFGIFMKNFEKDYGYILIMTRKGSVGLDINPFVDITQVTLTADDDKQIQQFNRRCRGNVREIIIESAEALTEIQKKWFNNKWDRVCRKLNTGVSINDFYVKRKINNNKTLNCICVTNPLSGASLYIGGIFLKIANLHQNFNFDNCFYGLQEFENFLKKYPKQQAFNYDVSIRRLKPTYITSDFEKPFEFTTNNVSYTYSPKDLVERNIYSNNHYGFIGYIQDHSELKDTHQLRNQLYSLACFFKGEKLTPEEIVRLPFLGAKWKDETIVFPKKSNYLATNNKWVMTSTVIDKLEWYETPTKSFEIEYKNISEKYPDKVKYELVYVEKQKQHKKHNAKDNIWVSPNGEEKLKSEWIRELNITSKYPVKYLQRLGYKAK